MSGAEGQDGSDGGGLIGGRENDANDESMWTVTMRPARGGGAVQVEAREPKGEIKDSAWRVS